MSLFVKLSRGLILGSSFLISCTIATKRLPAPVSRNQERISPGAATATKRPVNPQAQEIKTGSAALPLISQGPDWRGLSPDQLQSFLEDPQFAQQRGEILFRLGEHQMARRNSEQASKYFNQIITESPSSLWAQQAQSNLDLLESLSKVSATTIGALLPLSGRNSAIGLRTLKAIEMGLGLHYGNSNFNLAVVDTQGRPDKARRGVERLVREDNVVAILGALSSREAESAALKADELGVPLMAFSQKAGLTDLSPMIYRNSLTPEMQIHHLVRTAVQNYGMKKFAILYPNDAYGIESANLFWDEVSARGGEITAAQVYDPNSTDFKHVCQRLVGKFYIEARLDEYKAKQKAFSNKIKKRSTRENVTADDILDPLVNFDAIFIPDSAKNMGQISAFLSYVGVKDVHLLGTNLWNGPGLARRAGHFQNSLLFVDGFSSSSTQAKNSRFVAEFKSLFKDDPTMLEIQAFEGALILRGLIMGGAINRRDMATRLLNLRDFPGAVGPLSMGPSREILRPLFSLTLRKGEVMPLE
jgi:branched-chain amino acid transport system substrate-binding protein